jgi:hypothetical protein
LLRVSSNKRTLVVSRLPGGSADSLRIVLRRGAVVSDSRLRRRARRRPSLSFAARGADTAGDRFSIKKTVRGR